MPKVWRPLLLPHAPMIGIVGSRRYPYAFIGEIVRTMLAVVKHPDEDVFVRELAIAGIDASVSTAMRLLLRYAATPESLAERAQEAWNMFHDSGRLTTSLGPREYVTRIDAWPNHDVIVCKVCMEVRARLLVRTGLRHVTARREKCQGWGHDVCITRVQWE
jgi:hypothetical protein